ncbi:site-2 protease family protein [bacterium]|nr:site-2 protease family protein [bacterium]
MEITTFFISLGIFMAAVIVHEVAHGYIAFLHGDFTAFDEGRLTINPLVHLDLVGSIILPLTLILIGAPVILGWAKPVPVNINNLRHPKRDIIYVALAGPLVNILMAIIFAVFLRLNIFDWHSFLGNLCFNGLIINLILAVFNMIPIPPLDGSKIISGLFSWKYMFRYSKLEPYGIILLFILLYFGLLTKVIWPLVVRLSSILVGGEIIGK